jgi:hypothetical protein
MLLIVGGGELNIACRNDMVVRGRTPYDWQSGLRRSTSLRDEDCSMQSVSAEDFLLDTGLDSLAFGP